jgi:hypothetical protein
VFDLALFRPAALALFLLVAALALLVLAALALLVLLAALALFVLLAALIAFALIVLAAFILFVRHGFYSPWNFQIRNLRGLILKSDDRHENELCVRIQPRFEGESSLLPGNEQI